MYILQLFSFYCHFFPFLFCWHCSSSSCKLVVTVGADDIQTQPFMQLQSAKKTTHIESNGGQVSSRINEESERERFNYSQKKTVKKFETSDKLLYSGTTHPAAQFTGLSFQSLLCILEYRNIFQVKVWIQKRQTMIFFFFNGSSSLSHLPTKSIHKLINSFTGCLSCHFLQFLQTYSKQVLIFFFLFFHLYFSYSQFSVSDLFHLMKCATCSFRMFYFHCFTHQDSGLHMH